MERKSLFYVVGGVLLILSAALSLFQEALEFSSIMYYYDEGALPRMLFKSGAFRDYVQRMDIMSLIRFGMVLLTGLILIAKAFVKDIVPDIAIVVLFALMAVYWSIPFLQNFWLFWGEGNFWVKSVFVCTSLLMVVAYGGMAAIILLKDSFGGFFFVPALAVAGKAFLNFVLYASASTIVKAMKMKILYMPFGMCLLVFVFDMVLVGALFAIGMAVKEN